MHERANCSDSDRASASIDAIPRECFTPAAAADAVSPTYLRAMVADLHPRIHKNVHGRSVHDATRHPSHSEGVHRVPYQPPADGSGGGRSSTPASAPCFPSLRLLGRPGTGALDPSASAHCTYSVPDRYSTPAATKFRISLRSSLPKPLGGNFAPSYIIAPRLRSYQVCSTYDATATDSSKPRFIVWKTTQKRPRPESSRCALLRWVASVYVGACRALDHAAELSRCLLHPHPYLPLLLLHAG